MALATHAPEPAPRPPVRHDWAHLAALQQVSANTAPITFDGERFGRTVAGAQGITSPTRHRSTSRRSGDGVADGVIKGIATFEAIIDTAPVDAHTTRSAASPSMSSDIIHRRAPVATAPMVDDLMSSTTTWTPDSWMRPERIDIAATAWTPETGFVVDGDTTPIFPEARPKMRLVGQRGSFDEAVAPEAPDPAPATRAQTEPVRREPTLRYVPETGPRTIHDTAPADLVALVRRTTGVDVGDATIDRSTATTDRAARMGALAFAERGVVHLPNELGPLDDPKVRAITAHELTHVAQQRARGSAIDENSPAGHANEAEARAVERSVADVSAVRPLFLRSDSSRPEHAPFSGQPADGVQRRAADDDDADYSWQERGNAPSASGGRATVRAVLGTFAVFAGGPSEEQEQERDRRWAEAHERDNAAQLQHRRDERYAELVDEAREAQRLEALRNDQSTDDIELDRQALLDLRRRLDDEMPFEFGIPHGIDPYPGTLPERPGQAHGDDDDQGEHGSDTEAADGDAGPTRRARNVAPDAPTVGREASQRRSGGLRHRSPAHDGDDDEPDYGWQERSASSNEMATTILGGALGGIFNSLFGDSDEEQETDRRRAEHRDLTKLMLKRKRKERELRSEALAAKRATALREETSFPIRLEMSEIADIRATVDGEMPLEFHDPEYLPSEYGVTIDQSGTIGNADDDDAADEQGADTDADETGTDAAGADENVTDDTTSESAAAATSDATAATDESDADGGDGSDRSIAAGAFGALGAAASQSLRPDGDSDPDDVDPDDVDSDDTETDDADDARRILAAASDVDLEHLAHRLYGRFRRDLRRELLIDRERVGQLADAI